MDEPSVGASAEEQPDARAGAYIEVNERGTPFLYFPDGDKEDGTGCREATVAEWSFWRECGRLRAEKVRLENREKQLSEWYNGAERRITELRSECSRLREQLDALYTLDSTGVTYTRSQESCTDIARAALGVVGPPADTGSGASAARDKEA